MTTRLELIHMKLVKPAPALLRAKTARLGSSLLTARFLCLVAWPLAATGSLRGGIGVLRTARSALSDDVTLASDPDHPEPG